MVNCFVSDKYPNVTGNVIDCFSAIDYLYSGTSRGAQGCAVCFSCAVMPFDGSLSPLGSGGQTPQMPQEEVNAGYDEWFKPGQVTPEVKRHCEPGYTTPPGLKLGKLPTPKTFYSTLLLGTRGGPL
ncbi:hypothetical protein DFH28DRAFT_1217157 [Melampsora americana]|nr:hypothetical protein DFH28DRAFT_1217157 [Melampsora americana]